jgi:intracellular sulfur oxidation DsrE/DsrF family protein
MTRLPALARGLAMAAPQTLFSALLSPAASAGQVDPLFVNLTSDDPHRLRMALSFARQQQFLGHTVEQQGLLAELLASGGTVLVCPLCMKHYGVKESEIMSGLQIGNPTKTGAALFRQGSQALSR